MHWRLTMAKEILQRLNTLGGLLVVPVFCILSAPGLTFAQDGDPGSDRSETFVPVEGPQVEDVPGGALMVGAYALVWLLVFGYIFMLSRRARNLEARILQLESRTSKPRSQASEPR